GNSYDLFTAVIENNAGEYVAVGFTASDQNTGDKTAEKYGAIDHWLVNTDADLNKQWDQGFGGSYTLDDILGMTGYNLFDAFPQITELPNGHLWFGGTSYGEDVNNQYVTVTKTDPGYGRIDYWTIETDADGNYLSDKAWGGNRDDYLNALMVDGNNDLLLAGHSNSPESGTKSQNPFPGQEYDYWLIKLKNDPCIHHPLCFRWTPLPEIPDSLVEVIPIPTCEEVMADALRSTLQHYAYEYKQEKLAEFRAKYQEQCANPENINDKFWLEYPLGYHHYTLYYYDRAGNLVRTVPPEGVELLDVSEPAVLARDVVTQHTLITDYAYNSLQQLVRQNTPDGNETQFYYNDIGQLRFSQNAQQLVDGTYSYTKYDPLGRVIEVGQSGQAISQLPDQVETTDFPSQNLEQRSLTYYTESNGVTYLNAAQRPQRFLQNRVSYSVYDGDGNLATTADQVTTTYSYDVGGNVEWMAQDIPELGQKFIGYSYDLVSGNVLSVQYQEGQLDQFYHRYTYDADNRLITAETSVDQILWEQDAAYQYYQHGPLARTEMGEDKLQGIDYVYTIHGWLKGINHSSLDPTKDPGRDNQANRFAPDAFGMELNYYAGDFQRSNSPFNNSLATTDALVPQTNHNLYNGNISTWTSQSMANTQGEDLQYEQRTGHQYRYDVLNRIKRADFKFYDGYWNATADYNTAYTYDANGNILTLNRNAYAAKHLAMDSMRYTYRPLTNQLTHVDDPVNAENYGVDIDDQDPDNYTYDRIGQLTSDRQEEIAQIGWTAYGKMSRLDRIPGSDKPALKFAYGAQGNRIMKSVMQSGQSTAMAANTYYVRDASGNIMAIYEGEREAAPEGIINRVHLKEQPLYGGERMGMRVDSILVRETLYPADGGDPVELITNYERVTEDRVMAITYEQMLPSLFGDYGSPMFVGGVSNVDVSGPTSSVIGFNPILFSIDQGEAVVRAEDRQGNLLFTAFTADKYQGNNNVCIVRDASNQVMPNSDGIISFWDGNGISMQVPGNSNQYYLFTYAPNRLLYAHLIDLSLPGNGTAANPLGAVIAKNQLISTDEYSKMLAVIEDNTGNNSSQLYAVKSDNMETTTLVRFEVTANGMEPPQDMANFEGLGAFGIEMQISPDGRRLALTNIRRMPVNPNAFFGEIVIFDLSADHTTVTLRRRLSQGLGNLCNSLEFTPSGSYLYLSRLKIDGTQTPPRGVYRYDLFNNNLQLVSNSVGTIRRGYNDRMYVVSDSARYMLEVSEPDGNFTLNEVLATHPLILLTNTGAALQEHRIFLAENEVSPLATRHLNQRLYELNDHLGNNRLVFGDVKLSDLDNAQSPIVESFTADLKSKSEYYAFGMPAVDRNSSDYRFGFQRQEEDDEIKGEGNSVNYKYRMHDVRLGRFLSIDPLAPDYPWNSVYAFSENRVVASIEV
ncbi:MAG: hypothetical protein AAFU67_03755, partial [Bacteroidota bacterium]